MKIKFHCRNDEKCSSDAKPFTWEIDGEAVMDHNNMATVFCPHCNRALKSEKRSPTDDPNEQI
jgi:hypothetical protein